jgi:trehalose 6-phosphate synthase
MNLVAKEYVACRVDQGGALVLSEFAGAATELKQAYLVNPHDLDELKDTLVRALEADPADSARRMRAMRRHVRTHDVQTWARSYLSALAQLATEEVAAGAAVLSGAPGPTVGAPPQAAAVLSGAPGPTVGAPPQAAA